MSTRSTISFVWRVGGVPTDVTSAVLADPDGTYGVQRTDTGATVVAVDTPLVSGGAGSGSYSYSFDDPAAGLTYRYYLKIVYNGATYFLPRTLAAADVSSSSYLTVAEADALAATLGLFTKYTAADDAAKLAALIAATADVDAAGPWQGRKYDLTTPQSLEFPRVPYESSAAVAYPYGGAVALQPGVPGAYGSVVWDWDNATNTAVVPAKVKLATLWQAEAILDGSLAKVLDALAQGVASKSTGGVSVSYRDPATLAGALAGASVGLCRQAANLLRPYRLKQGRVL